MPRIVLITRIAASADECFDLSLSVDAHAASMSGSGERVVGGVQSGAMTLGDSVTWRARHFSVPFTMTSTITAFDRPNRFVDEQVSGPFGRWWHEHSFEQEGVTTTMTDVVEFASPFGPIGRLVDAVALTRYMTRLLTQRNHWLAEALAS